MSRILSTPRSWTPDEDRILSDLWKKKTSRKEISRLLDRSESSIASRARDISLVSYAIFKNPEKIHELVLRPCLRCGRPFNSEGKHHRICSPCKETEEWRENS
jgi:hypothetical protein